MGKTEDQMASRLALRTAKKELRAHMKTVLSSISSESVKAQSVNVCKLVTQLQEYKTAARIGIYLSMPAAEIQTDEIVRDALLAGKKVFVPYLYKRENPPVDTPKSVMDMVDLRSLSDYTSLKRDGWGIPTIDAETVPERERILGDLAEEASSEGLDMIIMPGVAFNVDAQTGKISRLGHGKGFYDFFMHRYLENRQGNDATKVQGTDVLLYGLALKEQLLQAKNGKTVPVGEWDRQLHGVIVGTGEIVKGPLNTE